MGKDLLIFSNIIIPTITGLFFFFYFLYFVIINNSNAPSFRYFIFFLVSFSLFLVGRPLQLLLGRHPSQLIIVNIRVALFFSVSIPSLSVASLLFSGRQKRRFLALIFSVGIFFALIYVVFNTLGTTGSYEVFKWGGLTAYDALTPAHAKPWYAREVTITVQILIGILMFVSSVVRLIATGKGKAFFHFIRDKNFLFNAGILLFALTFIIGSFTKQWWLYYFTSMFSAFLFGTGILIDIKEVHNNYEKLIPFIKEDIIQNVAFSGFSKKKLIELLHCLGKDSRLDTFAVVMLKDTLFETNYELRLFDSISNQIRRDLDQQISDKNYILIPLDNQRIGLVLNVLNNGYYSETDVMELMEKIQSGITQKTEQQTAIGIGRSYAELDDLRTSYHEALDALQYATRLEHSAVVHVNNIHDSENTKSAYPFKQKARLLSAIKIGDLQESRIALKDFLDSFGPYIKKRPDILKVRLYELIGAFTDSAVVGGGDEKQLHGLIKKYFNEIDLLSDYQTAEKWLQVIIEQIVQQVASTHKNRKARIIEKAVQIIQKDFASKISYKDVARELCISSSYFLSIFRQETDMTFVDYLTSVRIDKSKELLVNSEMSITEISFEIGINNPNYFSSMFRKNTGMSAKDYRNKHQPSPANK
ncbi:MAG: helix-turn-helix domain-containing protein [Spirochaetales bacterium]|nr:helix-turn-helix domain-containing protein [Spirochaetales bacterium]